MGLVVKNIDFGRKDISNKLMIFRSDRKTMEFCHLAEKGHI